MASHSVVPLPPPNPIRALRSYVAQSATTLPPRYAKVSLHGLRGALNLIDHHLPQAKQAKNFLTDILHPRTFPPFPAVEASVVRTPQIDDTQR
jgi:hypothetical protein